VLPAIQLLLVVSQQPWGRQLVLETPGLIEWLLDREAACGVHKSTGSGGNPECLRAKFDVAKVLNASADVGVSADFKINLAEFVQQGPFFKRGLYEVATEAPGN
jgi:Proteasome non-ATPase 26S subunit